MSVPVLAYHSVSSEATHAFRRYCVSPEAFAAHMAFLAEHGYVSLTVTELAATLAHGAPERAVVLTFDDAYRDFSERALPVLRDLGLTATLFVPTAFVGRTSSWLRREGEATRPLMTWEGLGDAVAAGIEVGAHSHSHAELDRLSDAALADEVALPGQLLEEQLGVGVVSFAYPFGFHSRRVRRAVAGAGYAQACATGELYATAGDDRFALPRLTVPQGTDVAGLRRLLAGRGRPGDRPLSELKRGAWQARRRWLPRAAA